MSLWGRWILALCHEDSWSGAIVIHRQLCRELAEMFNTETQHVVAVANTLGLWVL